MGPCRPLAAGFQFAIMGSTSYHAIEEARINAGDAHGMVDLTKLKNPMTWPKSRKEIEDWHHQPTFDVAACRGTGFDQCRDSPARFPSNAWQHV